MGTTETRDKTIFILMGVSGCGKTTIGKLLQEKTAYPFFDADSIHSSKNIQKMMAGTPLDDNDRFEWLDRIVLLIQEILKGPYEYYFIACSALKSAYRDILRKPAPNIIRFIYLKGDRSLIYQRLLNRSRVEAHFMPISQLDSQMNLFENPTDESVFSIKIKYPPETIVSKIIKYFHINIYLAP